MNVLFDYFDKRESPSLILCTPNLDAITALGPSFNIVNTLRYTAVSELTFDFPESIDNGETTLDSYSKIKNKMIVLVQNVGYFEITDSSEDDSGKVPVKHVTCQSLESKLMFKRITGFSGTFNFYSNEQQTYSTLIQSISNYIPDWDFAYIDSDLNDLWRTFDIGNTNVYSFMINDVSKAYNCIFTFDYLNKRISAYSISNLGESSNVYFSQNNLNKKIEVKEYSDEIATVLHCYGGTDLTIRGVNPLGTNALYNFNYYKTTEWMEQTLINAITAWEEKFDIEESSYAGLVSERNLYIDRLVGANSTLVSMESSLSSYLTSYEAMQAEEFPAEEIQAMEETIYAQRVAISSQKKVVFECQVDRDRIDKELLQKVTYLQFTGDRNWYSLYFDAMACYKEIESNSQSWRSIYFVGSPDPEFDLALYQASVDEIEFVGTRAYLNLKSLMTYAYTNYEYYWNLRRYDITTATSKLAEVIADLEELYGLFFNIIPYTVITNKLYTYITKLDAYYDIVEYDSNFTEQEYNDLQAFIFENTYTNENIITTDIMDEKEIQAQAVQLYNQGKEILERVSTPRYEVSGEFVDFLSLIEYEDFIEKIDLGKSVIIQTTSGSVAPLLLEISFSYDNPLGSTFVFSNKVKLNSSNFQFADLFISSTGGTSGVSGISGGGGTAITSTITSSSSVTGTNLLHVDNAIISKLGYISFGVTPPETYGNTQGVWLGWSSGAKLSLYSSDTDYLQWDGQKLLVKARNFTLDSQGNITATSASLAGKISAEEGDIAGWIISSNTLHSGSITLNSSTPSILMGNVTGYNSGTGVFLGKDVDGEYKMHIGDPSGDYFFWDGSDEIMQIATGGDWLAGWTINSNSLSSPDGKVVITSNSGSYTFYANGTFAVTPDGELLATSASISGSIIATSGSIGGWEIKETYIKSDLITINSASPAILMGDVTGYNSGTGVFIGKDSDNEYKLHIGDPTGDYFFWDGTNASELIEVGGNWLSGWTLDGNALISPYEDISINSASPAIMVGNTSASMIGSGVFIGPSAFRLGDPDASYILWDSSSSALGLYETSIDISGSVAHVSIGDPAPSGSSTGTGIWIDNTGLYSIYNDGIQVGISTVDGKFNAGADTITIDREGININTIREGLSFFQTNGSTVERIGGILSGASPSNEPGIVLYSSNIVLDDNMVTNGSFSGSSGWTGVVDGFVTAASSTTTDFYSAPSSGYIEFTNGSPIAGFAGMLSETFIPVVSGSMYAMSTWYKLESLTGVLYPICYIGVTWYTAAFSPLSSIGIVAGIYGTDSEVSWRHGETFYTAPATAAYAQPFISAASAIGAGTSRLYFDDIKMYNVSGYSSLLMTDTYTMMFANSYQFYSGCVVINGSDFYTQGEGLLYVSGSLNVTGEYIGTVANKPKTNSRSSELITSYTSGERNTTYGALSGNSITEALNNVGVGYNTLNKLTTGDNNVAIGAYALDDDTTGRINVAIGSNALTNSKGGNYNTAIGYIALRDLITGQDNVAIGTNAGRQNNGSWNTFIGHYAGAECSSGSLNVFIGNNAGEKETGSNKLYIDNSNSASPLIYGDFSTNKLTVNGDLRVTGSIVINGMSGSEFPSSPIDEDFFYRSDLGLWCFYDGTRWLSETVFTTTFNAGWEGAAFYNVIAIRQDYNIYVERITCGHYVLTTNNSSNYWSASAILIDATLTSVNLHSFTSQTESPDTWSFYDGAPTSASIASNVGISLNVTSVGSPGLLLPTYTFYYRLIIT